MRRFLALILPAGLVRSARGVLAVAAALIAVAVSQAAGAEAVKPAETSAAKPAAPAAPPPKGSHVPQDKNNCVLCHGDSDLWEGEQRRLYISLDKLKQDVHWLKGVNCHDCHGGNYQTQEKNPAHAVEDGFRAKPAEVKKFCAACHKEQAVELLKGVHDKAGPKNDRGQGTPLECGRCHGTVSHELAPVRDPKSPVFLDHQMKTCGGCHTENLDSYLKSVHGQGFEKMGLQVVPACADCHGAHGVYRAVDKRSTLHTTRVAQTCGKCHRFIEERLAASVHGRGNGAGGLATRDAPGAEEKPGQIANRKPSCTSCHVGHDLAQPTSATFREGMSSRCGTGLCHARLSSQYGMSIHGKLSELGYTAAAKCSDCHGAHDILPVSEAGSRLSKENRAATCGECHANVVRGFLSFDPHADYTDAQRSPLPHLVYKVLLALLLTTFGVFGVHSVLWFSRGLVDVLKNGRPGRLQPHGPAYIRFPRFHRIGHAVMLLAFLGLALTGLPLKYSHTDWAQGVARALGGFASTSFWHRVCALVTFGCFIAYLVRLAWLYWAGRRRGNSRTALVFGPDSPIPSLRDVKDAVAMLRWFFGLGPKPTFDRWGYWEKFDFWGAAGDIVIIGSTGLLLWFPNFFCRFLPGTWLNVAQVIHSTQALLATGFVFAVHFFNTHLRPDIFPVDRSVLTGLISEEEFRDTRPELFERLRQQGQLDELRTTAPSRRTLWFVTLAGYAALGVGLALLVGMVVAGLGG